MSNKVVPARRRAPRYQFTPVMKPALLYAREGEWVYCTRGHQVGQITRDLLVGEKFCGDEVSGCFTLPKQPFPPCRRCGALMIGPGGLLFEDGWRVFK